MLFTNFLVHFFALPIKLYISFTKLITGMTSILYLYSLFQAPLCNVQEMKFTKKGKPFVLDFLPKVGFEACCS